MPLADDTLSIRTRQSFPLATNPLGPEFLDEDAELFDREAREPSEEAWPMGRAFEGEVHIRVFIGDSTLLYQNGGN